MEGVDPSAAGKEAKEPEGASANEVEVIWLDEEDENASGSYRERGVYSLVADELQANRARKHKSAGSGAAEGSSLEESLTLEVLGRRLDDHETRLTGLEGSVSQPADLNGGKAERLEQLQAAVDSVTDSAVGVAAAVEALKGEAGEVKDRVKSLSKRVADSKGAAAAAATAAAAELFAKFDSGMAQLEAEGLERDTALGGIKSELESLCAWVDALHEQVVAGRREAKAAPLDAVPLAQAKRMAEEAVGELRGGVSRKLAHVTALLAHTQSAMSRIDTHEAVMRGLKEEVAALAAGRRDAEHAAEQQPGGAVNRAALHSEPSDTAPDPALAQVEVLRGELAAVRKEAAKKLTDLEARLQEQLASSWEAEQLHSATAKGQKNEVGAVITQSPGALH